MNILEKIRKQLGQYPQIKAEILRTEFYESITIKATDNGFQVSLFLYDDGEFQVCGDGWRYEHQNLKGEDEAIEKFMLCLSNKARLRISSRGQTDYRWTIEVLRNDKWEYDTAVLNFPEAVSSFWRKKNDRILQNNYI